MAIIVRCYYCQTRFELEDETALIPVHPANPDNDDGACCCGEGMAGVLIADDVHDPRRDTTSAFREKLLAKASA